MILLEITFMIT